LLQNFKIYVNHRTKSRLFPDIFVEMPPQRPAETPAMAPEQGEQQWR
jgi:hypothetical protein